MSVSKNSQLGYCVNCRHSNINDAGQQQQQPEEIIYEIKIDNNVDDDPLIFSTESVTVEEILTSIYKLQYLDELKFLDLENSSSSSSNNNNNNKNDGEEEEREKIGICYHCHPVLVQLFKLFNQFNGLRVFDSYLSHKLVKLDDLIHRVQTTTTSITTVDDDWDEGVTKTDWDEGVTKIDWDEGVTKIEPDEEADSGPAVSQLMQINIDESQRPTSPPPHVVAVKKEPMRQQDFSTAKNPNENLFPVVKLCRLNETEIEAATNSMTRVTKMRQKGHQNGRKTRVRRTKKIILESFDSDDGCSNQNNFETTTTTTSDLSMELCDIKEDPDASSSSSSSSFSPSSSKTKKKKKKTSTTLTPKTKPVRKTCEAPVDGVCPVCTVSFKIHRNLYKHLLTHIGPENSCPFPNCLQTFTYRKTAINHIRRHTQYGDKCPIPNCGKFQGTKRKHREHLRSHWRSGTYICDLGTNCEQIFSSETLLLSHRQSAHPKIVIKCPSTSCLDKIFETELQLKAHVKTSHPGLSLYSCDICSRPLSSRMSLKSHLAAVHEGKLVKCSRNCGRKFMNEQLAKEHEEKCDYNTYFCHVCAKNFRDKYYFNLHLQTHKNDAPTFKCDYEGCDKTYFSQSAFSRHLRKHTGERPYVCDQCGMAFFTCGHLRRHFIVHSSEKPHQCPVCGKRFLREVGLNLHMMSHSDTKQFPCTACDKIFKFKASRHLHFVTVHKEGFTCHLCGVKFPYNINLQKHLATVHPEQQQPEEADEMC